MIESIAAVAGALGAGGAIAWWLNRRLTEAQARHQEGMSRAQERDEVVKYFKLWQTSEAERASERAARTKADESWRESMRVEMREMVAASVRREESLIAEWTAKCDALQARIVRLEVALREAGITPPNGDH